MLAVCNSSSTAAFKVGEEKGTMWDGISFLLVLITYLGMIFSSAGFITKVVVP